MATATQYDWKRCSDQLPPLDVEVMTKIDDSKGCRNEQTLKRYQREPHARSLWFVPGGSMYVYYEPTHWAYVRAVVHTPGPWKCERLIDNAGKPYATHYEAHIDLEVCMVWAPPGNAEQEANARLIAAAPDLLEACKMYLDAMERYGHPDKTDRLMRAAIEKATGEVV